MRRITFHEDAENEMTEAARYYESRAIGLGYAFLDEVDHAATAVAEKPEAFQLIGRGSEFPSRHGVAIAFHIS